MERQFRGNWHTLRRCLHPRRWGVFWAVWLCLGLISWGAYERAFGWTSEVFPELGMCRSFVYGNTVQDVEKTPGQVRLLFGAVPPGSGLGGGAGFANIMVGWGIGRDFPIRGPDTVHLRVKGARGGEKFELKLKNRYGEGWCIVGGDRYPVTTQFRDIAIPTAEFQAGGQSAMGRPFRQDDGLSTVVFGVGGDTACLGTTDVQVARLHVSSGVRHDWVWCILVLVLAFGASAIARLVHIAQTHFRVFVSYASGDHETAANLVAELKCYDIASWWAPTQLSAIDMFTEQIAFAIRSCRYFLLLASPRSHHSQYVGIEIGMRVRRDFWYLLGLDRPFKLALLDKRNIFVVVMDNDASVGSGHSGTQQDSVREILHEHQYLRLSEVSVEKAAEEIAAIVYLGRAPERREAPQESAG